MSECCPPSVPCCGGGYVDTFEYGPQPFETGSVFTMAGQVPAVATELTRADRRGALKVRANIRRDAYRVKPGLYAIGDPDDTAPVIVTGNYKLTFDTVRAELTGRDIWLLIIDSRGVNVWCAAGKGVFSTAEVVRMVREVRLEQVVSHQRLVLPQLAATGVAGHEVRAQTGFAVTWAPVRASDLPAFFDAGLKATPEMRQVEFPLRDRAKLVGVELSVLWSPKVLAAIAVGAALAVALAVFAPAFATPIALAVLTGVLAVAVGAGLTPLLLPWVPGRMFALKGAIVGAVVIGGSLALAAGLPLPLYAWGLLAAGTALASFSAMNFTGSSTYTSPSGVEFEMRRAIPWQVAGAVVGVLAFVVGLWVR